MAWLYRRRGRRSRMGAFAITVIVALGAGVLALASDRLLERYAFDLLRWGPTARGLLYVLVTAAVFYPLLRGWNRYLRRDEERYRMLFDSAGDAIFMHVDSRAEGQPLLLVEVNRVACEWLGYSREELLALPCQVIDDGSLGLGQRPPMDEWEDDGRSLTEGELVTRDGRRIPVEVSTHRFLFEGTPVVVSVVRDITDRRMAEAESARERDLLHALMDNIPDQIYFKDRDLRFTRINPAQAAVLGLADPAEAIGRRDADYFAPDHVRDAVADERRILATRKPMSDKLERIRHASGEYRWVSATKAPIMDDSGRVTGIVGISRDITDRRNADQELRVRDAALNTSIAGILFAGMDGAITHANPSFLRMWGFADLDQVRGRNAATLFASDELRAEIVDGLRRAGRYAGEVRALRSDGSSFDAQFWASVVYDEEGTAIAVMASAVDITERLSAERALRESEEKYRLLVENANEAILVVQDSWLRFANRRAEALTRVSRDELLGLSIVDLVHPDDRAMVMTRHRERMQGRGYSRPYAFRIVDARHEVRWVEVSAVTMEWEGAPATLVFVSDITERKQTEDALRESEERYRMLVNNQGEGIATADEEDCFTFANPAAEEIFGVEPGTLVGRHIREFTTPEQCKAIRSQTALRRQGLKSTYEIEIIRPDGEERTLLLTAASQTDRAGRFVGTFGIFRDVTGRKRAEREREELIAELQAALAQVKTLRGLLPICANCKKVRDDGGYWHMVETYVRDHSQAEFTHTLCPECMAKLYPQYADAGEEEQQ